MAVTISVAELAAAIRLGATAEETAQVTRLRGYAIEAIQNHLGSAYEDAPEATLNEATIRLVGYLYDVPHASRGDAIAFSLRSSGAARMLLPYRVHSLGTTESAMAATGGDAGGRLDQAAVQALIDAALATHAAEANAHHVPPTLPMPATTTEAANGTSTTIRAWTAALIRTAIHAVVPAWARIGDSTLIPAAKLTLAPSSSGGGGSGLMFTNLGSHTVTGHTADAVIETSISIPASGLYVVITMPGDGDTAWFVRDHLRNTAGVPVAGQVTNASVTAFGTTPQVRIGNMNGRFAIINAFATNQIPDGTTFNFGIVG